MDRETWIGVSEAVPRGSLEGASGNRNRKRPSTGLGASAESCPGAELVEELVERMRRRRFSVEYALRIVREAESCWEPSGIGALLRSRMPPRTRRAVGRRRRHSRQDLGGRLVRRGLPVLLVLLVAALGICVDLASAQGTRTLDVRYENGPIDLAALLMLPPGEGLVPAAVIAQGSGASDRSNQWSREIAEELVGQGIAVLLTDKRGAGASSGDWRTAGFSDLAADVLAGAEFLGRRSDIDSGRIGIVGLSQGGQVAPIAAASSDQIAFVISISSKAVGFAEGSFLEMANTARQAGLSEPDVQEVIRVNLAAVRYLTSGKWEQYEQARERALQTGARRIAAGFPASEDEPVWTFLRAVAGYDPLAYWVQVSQPVLVVYGEEDERNNVPVRESVRRLEHVFGSVNKTNHRIMVVSGAGHGIRDPQTHRLAPRFRDTLGEWLEEHVRR